MIPVKSVRFPWGVAHSFQHPTDSRRPGTVGDQLLVLGHASATDQVAEYAEHRISAVRARAARLDRLRRANITVYRLVPSVIADYWLDCTGSVADGEFLDRYMRCSSRKTRTKRQRLRGGSAQRRTGRLLT